MAGKRKNTRQDYSPRKNTGKKISGSNQILGVIIVVVIGIGLQQIYSGGKIKTSSGESRQQPTLRPVQENPWEAMGQDSDSKSDKPWVKKFPGSFKKRVWLSTHEEHPNPNIRDLPEGSLGKWSSENPPGHMGAGVELGFMSKKAKDLREKMFKQHYFDEFISELIPLDRQLPDWRGQWCKDHYDEGIETLEPTSIIICFHNEAMSTLLRTVHTVINSTPRSLIKENFAVG
ncbi:GALNT [Lepeophtheirus salmonis]|uniref:GALNT n=1 Tax=Lepeophtheirus salmonis TaxID=72036 RepID=A0A7R8CPF1_LEPSM|nr:GALNT [Lepeophtheirus salmonis]CAF2885732.1 GALNT [Lepeophtheirus salmonis]